jgi:gliding motility-associated-like protein
MIIAIDSFPSNAVVGPNQVICGDSAVLSANTPNTGTGAWSVYFGTGTFSDTALATSSVNNLSQGINMFIWTTSNGQCPSSHDTVTITSDLMPDNSFAGKDTTVCEDTLQLNANTPLTGTGMWTNLNTGATFSAVANANTFINSLTAGNNFLVWTISNGICPQKKDTVRITRDMNPSAAIAGPDITSELNSFQLTANSPNIGIGQWVFISGTGNIATPFDTSTMVNGLNEGTTLIAWTITNGVCPATADTIVMTLNGLFIPQVITPNGDGKNDYFEIRAYENITGLSLEIFNRWGDMVYKKTEYKNDFEGENMFGEELPDDTYFYILITPENITHKGYLELKRK